MPNRSGWVLTIHLLLREATWSITEGVIFLTVIRKFRSALVAAFVALGLLSGGAIVAGPAQAAAAIYTPEVTWIDDAAVAGKGTVVIDTASALDQGFAPGQTLSYRVATSENVDLGQLSLIIGDSGEIDFVGATPGSKIFLQTTGGEWTFSEHTIPAIVDPPSVPIQSATIAIDPATGNVTINLATGGTGVGSYHIIVNGDLTRPAVNVAAGSTQQVVLPGLLPGTSIQVRVYGNGSGSGFLLATEVVPTLPDDTATKKIEFCHATHPRAEAYELTSVSVSAFLNANHGQHEGDIVPPFTYVKEGVVGSYPGNRWNEEGIAIYNNGCAIKLIPTPTETATPSPTPTETETATPSPTATTPTATTASSETPKVIPSESTKSEVAIVMTSKNPGSYVDTAAPAGGSGIPPASAWLYLCSMIAAAVAVLLFCRKAREVARH